MNVPLLVKSPAIFIDPDGAVSAPLMVTLLNDEVFEPDMDVVPPNVVVPEPAFRVPLFVKLPLI